MLLRDRTVPCLVAVVVTSTAARGEGQPKSLGWDLHSCCWLRGLGPVTELLCVSAPTPVKRDNTPSLAGLR